MVFFVLFIAVLNLVLGYALAIYVARGNKTET
jgi:hypothetical protein